MKSIGFNDFRPFQSRALLAAQQHLDEAKRTGVPTLVVLEAPTASGKTVITAGLLEQFMQQLDPAEGPPTIVWLSYSPVLNEQSKQRIEELTDLFCESLTTTAAVTELPTGKAYFLNIGLLGRLNGTEGKDTVKRAARETLKKTLIHAIATRPRSLLIVIDEAHRGTGSVSAELSLIQKLLESPADLLDAADVAMVPPQPPRLVLAISATPTKLIERYTKGASVAFSVMRTPRISMKEVANQGLLKKRLWVETGNFDSAATTALAVFQEALAKRDALERTWITAAAAAGRAPIVPLLLVQLANREEGSFDDVSLELMETAARRYGLGAAHVLADAHGLPLRAVDALAARDDASVRVIFYQASLDEGWDCPRAQILFSLRTQLEKDRVSQIIGRVLRMPGAAHTGNLDCDTAYLYAPLFLKGSAEDVKTQLEADFGDEGEDSAEGFVALNATTLKLKPYAHAKLSSVSLPATRTVEKPLSVFSAAAGLWSILGEFPDLEAEALALKRQTIRALTRPEFIGDLNDATAMDDGWTVSITTLGDALPSASDPVVAPVASSVRYEASPDAVLSLLPRLANSALSPLLRELLAELSFQLEAVDPLPLIGALYRTYVAWEKHGTEMEAAVRAVLIAFRSEHTALAPEALRCLEDCLSAQRDFVWQLPQSVRYATPTQDSPKDRVAAISREAMELPNSGAFEHIFRSSWEPKALLRVVSASVVAVFRNPESHDQGGFSLAYQNSFGKLANFFPDFLVFHEVDGRVVVDFVEPKGGDSEGRNKRKALLAYAAQHAKAPWMGNASDYWGDPSKW